MGRVQAKIFDHVENFEEFTDTIYNMIKDNPQASYMDESSLEESILSLAKMTDNQKKYTLKFVHQVDRKLSFACAARGNIFHKLPTVLSGCIYIANHEDSIRNLTMDELIVLSYFSIVEPPGFYEGAVEYLGKDLLTAVTQKHFDYTSQSAFLDYAESRIRDGYSKEETAEYIRDISTEQLKKETFEHDQRIFEKAGIRL